MQQDAKFLRVGRELHANDLEGISVCKLNAEERELVNRMLRALKLHKFYQRMKKGCQYEKTKIKYINGVKVKGKLDVLKPGEYVMDLKTTVCESYEDFIYKANQYGYFRQAWIYQMLSGCTEVYFVAVQKQEPYKVMILRAMDYPLLMQQAKNEVAFLLWYFKQYGFPYEAVNGKKHESKKLRTNKRKHNTTRNHHSAKRSKNYFTFAQWQKAHGKKR